MDKELPVTVTSPPNKTPEHILKTAVMALKDEGYLELSANLQGLSGLVEPLDYDAIPSNGWQTIFAGSGAYWMDDQDSEPDPVAWQKLLPGPFERTEAALCAVCESTVSEGYDMTIGLEGFFKELGEPDYKLARMSHGAEPWHYWSRESIEAACQKLLSTHTPTLADALKADEQALHRRVVHHTAPKGPLSLDEAISLSEKMASTASSPGK